MGLTQEIEERTFVPLRRGETPITGRHRNDGRDGFAGHAAQRLRPEGEEILRDGVARLECALRIGEPIFGDAAKGLNRIDDARRKAGGGSVCLRLQDGAQRQPALLDHDGEIFGKPGEIDTGAIGLRLGVLLGRLSRRRGAAGTP